MEYEDDYDEPFIARKSQRKYSSYYMDDDVLTFDVMRQVMAYPLWSLSDADVISTTKKILKELFEKGE